MLEKEVTSLAQKHLEEMVRIRRHLHRYPELSAQEHETARFIGQALDRLGIEYETVAETGILATIRCKHPGKTVLLRADIDALPIQEEVDIPYRSEVPGVMHACGHDGHTAGVLGAAMILNDLKDELCGTIKLMFQPAEEEIGGARRMVEEGILENPNVDAAFALHIEGDLAEGTAQLRYGPMHASDDTFKIVIRGKGGHAAYPFRSIDSVLVASQAVTAINTVVSRMIPATEIGVVSCCVLSAGGSYNTIPDTVEITGMIRAMEPDIRQTLIDGIDRILKGITYAYGADYDFTCTELAPSLHNDENLAKLAVGTLFKLLKEENVHIMKHPYMGSEDFAYVSSKVPAVYVSIGVMEKDQPSYLHTSTFHWDDKNLAITSNYMAQAAIDFLSSKER